MKKEDRKKTFLYCKFRDELFAVYEEYAKRNGMLIKALFVINVLFNAKDGLTQAELCKRAFQSKQTGNLIMKNLFADDHYVPALAVLGDPAKDALVPAQVRATVENKVRWNKC